MTRSPTPLRPYLRPACQGMPWCAPDLRDLAGIRKLFVCVALGALPTGHAADVLDLPADSVQVVGADSIVITRYEDTFSDIARTQGLGYTEMVIANPDIDPWLPGEGSVVALPSRFILPDVPREGVVINLAEYRLYYFYEAAGRSQVATFPISIGRMDWETPLGVTRIVSKAERPTWYPPESVRAEHAADGDPLPRVVPPGPDNPLGEYALRLGIPGYLIHGTNRPAGVGLRVTHGCIRMYPEDIEWLYPKVSNETPVRIIDQPYKLGWSDDGLYLEVHPPLNAESVTPNMTEITELYVRATGDEAADIDWGLVSKVFNRQSGRPVKVGSRLETVPVLADN